MYILNVVQVIDNITTDNSIDDDDGAEVNVVIRYGILRLKVYDQTVKFCTLTNCPAEGDAVQLVIEAPFPNEALSVSNSHYIYMSIHWYSIANKSPYLI